MSSSKTVTSLPVLFAKPWRLTSWCCCRVTSCATGSSTNTGQAGDEVLEYITGVKPVPLTTYFVGSTGLGAQRALEALELVQATMTPDQPRIHYLGRSGLVNLAGLSVAYLDGIALAQASPCRP